MEKNQTKKNQSAKKPPVRAGEKLTYEKIRSSKAARLLYDSGAVYFLLAFAVPVILMLMAFKKQGIHPFGDQQMLVVDLWHQYYPFFRVVREKLAEGGSFLYSWENGLGTNFLALIAYYALSPLNWIAVLFSEENSRDVMTYILLAKIGFCGAFFSCFLRYTFRHKDISIVIFSTMFALCSYMLGYYWNVMWFDTIAMMPLVMTGVVAICREGKWKLYTFSLLLALVFNYYIGFFICVFTVLMFAVTFITEGCGIKQFLPKLWLIARSSVLGIGAGAAILLPAYKGLQLAYNYKYNIERNITWQEKWTDFIANLLSYNEPTAKEGLANIACGMLAVVLIGVFVFSGGIKLREKIAYILLLAFMAVSLNLKYLDYAWHGFHVTNQLPYRYSFLFSFVLLIIAYRAYDILVTRGIKIYQLVLLLLGPGLVFGMKYLSFTTVGKDFSWDLSTKSSLLISGAYVLIFAAVKFIPAKSLVTKRTIMNIAVGATVLSEFVKLASLGVTAVGSSGYSSYPDRQESVQVLKSIIAEQDDRPFYRMEMTSTYTLNDSALYGYNGVSQFSSMANVIVTQLCMRLGLYGSELGNRYFYRTAPPTVNALFGVDYIMHKGGALNNSEMAFEWMDSDGSVNLYRNRYPLSLGFMMRSDIKDLSEKSDINPFEYQNDLFRLATGCPSPVFKAQPVALASYDNIIVDKKSYGYYEYQVEDRNDDAMCIYKYNDVPGCSLYGYAKNGAFETLTAKHGSFSVDGNVSVKSYPVVFPIGDCTEDGQAAVEFEIKKDGKSSGNYTIMVYALDYENFDSVYDALADEQFSITSFSDTRITGTVDALESGVMYFSIPYEKGWKVIVDGKETPAFKVLGAMLGVEVDSGHHEIELKYAPEGFMTGLIITGIAFLLLVICIIADRCGKKSADKTSPEPVKVSRQMDDISGAAFSADLGEGSGRMMSGTGKDDTEVSADEKSEGNDSVSGN